MTVTHLRFDGTTGRGELVVHRDAAAAVVRVVPVVARGAVPVAQMRTVDAYGSDDARSMAANNTSAYNCRRTTAARRGRSTRTAARSTSTRCRTPTSAARRSCLRSRPAYVDRTRARPGMVLAGGPVVRAFADVAGSGAAASAA